ncbi:Dot/Icm type IV secretion system effector PhnB [Streptomyces paradoxus]|uniref:Putative glyoxalase superfamily protein PhnB n=1 Tax=Streptomyces paradoxus TaxID=66375 RepID=A0A7W9THQ0_9ACTN|nr:VOC family protein [Streptomyces paradoxus]MBB6080281.1 putative glyoxalase superfamily protein PhnB [Streptomyces paradoxus]
MTVQPIPDGYHTVTPWIISRDTAGLIDYLKEAFDAEEIARVVGEDGRIGHAEVRIGDSIVMPFDAPPDWPPTPAFLRLYVEDADAAHRRAVAAGGTSVTEVTHLFFGDRIGRVRDPLGNLWWLQTRVEDVSPEEMERRLHDPKWTEAMAYVQGADFFPGATGNAHR